MDFLSNSGEGLLLTQTDSAEADAFFQRYGSVFGISDASTELVQIDATTDSTGMQHVSYRQVYQGVPVFAGIVRVHFNSAGQLTAANGVFVPNLKVNSVPSLSDEAAAETAVAVERGSVDGATNDLGGLRVTSNTLYIYRDGLIQGVPDPNYLVYEVQVTNETTVRDFVYVDAHSGNIINHVSAVMDGLDGSFTSRTPAI